MIVHRSESGGKRIVGKMKWNGYLTEMDMKITCGALDLSDIFPLDVVWLVMDAVFESATWLEYVQFVELGATWARVGRANLSEWVRRRSAGERFGLWKGDCEEMKFVGNHMKGTWKHGDEWGTETDRVEELTDGGASLVCTMCNEGVQWLLFRAETRWNMVGLTERDGPEWERVDTGAFCAVLIVELGDGTWWCTFILLEPSQVCRNAVDRMVDEHWRYLLGRGTVCFQGQLRGVLNRGGFSGGSRCFCTMQSVCKECAELVASVESKVALSYERKVVYWDGRVFTRERVKLEQPLEEILRKASGAKAIDFLWWSD